MSRLELRQHPQGFGALEVLDGISLSVADGEFVSILGPSGAGKSTLFQLLTGALRASGAMRFDGAPLRDRRPFAFMPQRDALMPWRRIIDNATLGLEVQGMQPPRGARAPSRRCLPSSALPASSSTIPPSFRAACASAPRCCAPWCRSATCCCSTSRSARSTH